MLKTKTSSSSQPAARRDEPGALRRLHPARRDREWRQGSGQRVCSANRKAARKDVAGGLRLVHPRQIAPEQRQGTVWAVVSNTEHTWMVARHSHQRRKAQPPFARSRPPLEILVTTLPFMVPCKPPPIGKLFPYACSNAGNVGEVGGGGRQTQVRPLHRACGTEVQGIVQSPY